MKKIHLVLVLLMLFAGCTTSNPQTNTKTDNTSEDESKTYGKELSVSFDDFPSTISSSSSEYFKIKLEAGEDIESSKILLYNLGSFLSSSCEGTTSVRDIQQGSSKQVSCTLKVDDVPFEEVEQEIKVETIYKISKDEGQIGFTIYDSEDFEKETPSINDKKTELSIGLFKIDSENIKEGESFEIEFDITEILGEGDICNCNIEKIVFKIPLGFSVSGLSGWNKYSCGGFSCFEKENLNSGDISFTLSIIGVTKTETFYAGIEVFGIWKQIETKEKVTILIDN